jgi:hypothetical protein
MTANDGKSLKNWSKTMQKGKCAFLLKAGFWILFTGVLSELLPNMSYHLLQSTSPTNFC